MRVPADSLTGRGPASRRPPHASRLPATRRGFTLLEMLVVLVIIGLVATIVGVTVMQSIHGAKVRAASKNIIAQLRYTRGQAILQREAKVFLVNTEKRTYQAPGHEPVTLPEGVSIALTTARSEVTGESSGGIRFFPDGSSTGGTVTLKAQERVWKITVGWLTGEIGLKEGTA